LLGVHRHTVREWIRRGLPTIDEKRPVLVRGLDLSAFLRARRSANKRTCKPGEIYCVRCRVPRRPAGAMAEYRPRTATHGDLVGICPSCDCMMYRRMNRTRMDEICADLDVSIAEGLGHIGQSPHPSANRDFREEPSPHANSQRE
jgi:hypothetical protein